MEVYLIVLPHVRVAGLALQPSAWKLGGIAHVAVSAWCSAHQLPGCECTGKRFCATFGCLIAMYISIYGHMQLYIHTFECKYNLQIYIYIYIYIYICIIMRLFACLFVLICFYIGVYRCI